MERKTKLLPKIFDKIYIIIISFVVEHKSSNIFFILSNMQIIERRMSKRIESECKGRVRI